MKNAAAAAWRAISRTPEVSLSSRCTRRGRSVEFEAQPVEQRIDMALGVGAALHREAGGLVDDQRPVVAVQHGIAQQRDILRPGARRLAAAAARRRLGQRRHPDRLARRDRVAGAGALAVNPDLPGAQQLFEPSVAEARIMPLEPAVEPPGAVLRPHGDGGDAAHSRALRGRAGAACPSNRAAS